MTLAVMPITPVAGTAPICSSTVKVIWSTPFTYTDCAGNSADWTYTYTIDIPPFTISTPNGSSTVNCAALAVAPTPPAVNDACGNALTPVAGTAPTAPNCEGDMVYSFTYTDCAGNSATWTYTYTIDIPPFTISTPNGSSTVNCAALAVAPTPPAVNDACGNALTPVAGTAPTAPNCEGDMVYSFTYTDCAGNSATWTYTYTIDIPPFTISTPNGSSTVNCAALAVAPTPPAVNDACGNALTPVAGTAPTAPNCEGDMVYSFTYTDCAGNSATWTYTYTIDIPPFTISTPNGSSTVNCAALAVAPTPPAVNDACGNALTPVAGTAPTAPNCEGDMVYSFTYTDCAGNSATWTYTYTIDIPAIHHQHAERISLPSTAPLLLLRLHRLRLMTLAVMRSRR